MLPRRDWLLWAGTTAIALGLPSPHAAAQQRASEALADGTPELLRDTARRGLAERLRHATVDSRYADRLDSELSILCGNPIAVRKLLLLHDVARFARREGIELGSGRGSSPGSIVCWTLGITDLDPIRF